MTDDGEVASARFKCRGVVWCFLVFLALPGVASSTLPLFGQ